MSAQHEIEAKEEWYEPEFGEARRRLAELEHDPARAEAREALGRIGIESADRELPGPTPPDTNLLQKIGPVHSWIDQRLYAKEEDGSGRDTL